MAWSALDWLEWSSRLQALGSVRDLVGAVGQAGGFQPPVCAQVASGRSEISQDEDLAADVVVAPLVLPTRAGRQSGVRPSKTRRMALWIFLRALKMTIFSSPT